MNIAGAQFDRLSEDVVDQTNDPCFSGHGPERVFILHIQRILRLLLGALELAEQPFEEGTADEAERAFLSPCPADQEGQLMEMVGFADEECDRIIIPFIGQSGIGVEEFGGCAGVRFGLMELLFVRERHIPGFGVEGRQFIFGDLTGLQESAVGLGGRFSRVGEAFRVELSEPVQRIFFRGIRRGHCSRTPWLSSRAVWIRNCSFSRRGSHRIR